MHHPHLDSCSLVDVVFDLLLSVEILYHRLEAVVLARVFIGGLLFEVFGVVNGNFLLAFVVDRGSAIA